MRRSGVAGAPDPPDVVALPYAPVTAGTVRHVRVVINVAVVGVEVGDDPAEALQRELHVPRFHGPDGRSLGRAHVDAAVGPAAGPRLAEVVSVRRPVDR